MTLDRISATRWQVKAPDGTPTGTVAVLAVGVYQAIDLRGVNHGTPQETPAKAAGQLGLAITPTAPTKEIKQC